MEYELEYTVYSGPGEIQERERCRPDLVEARVRALEARGHDVKVYQGQRSLVYDSIRDKNTLSPVGARVIG